jgi:hypothetical protein
MIRMINKSAYQRTAINKTMTIAFETEAAYLSWLKANSSRMIHGVENNENGLIVVIYS